METLLHRLQTYGGEDWVPFHMPGHKRNTALAPYLAELNAAWDITEIAGFDDLHHPEGVLRASMALAARVWGSRRTFYLVGGSSAGLLAGIRAATRRGGKVLLGRNCHKSIYHALELCDLHPVFLQPETLPGWGFYASLTPEQVEKALEEHPDVQLMILTSPTYDGVCSDVASIAGLAHSRGIPLLVDEAHGAHFGFSPGFPKSAVAQGADIVIQSVHKTLPSLTQSAIAHLNGDLVPPDEMARQLNIFQTSSPSYLLLASLDACARFMEGEGKEAMARWEENLADFDREIVGLKHLEVFGYGKRSGQLPPGLFHWDKSKLLISTHRCALNGVELERVLRQEYAIELELYLENYVIAMTGLGTTREHLHRLAAALLAVDAAYGPGESQSVTPPPPLPQRQRSLALAVEQPWALTDPAGAEGRLAGEYLWAYPPGIPLITPGEVFSRPLLDQLEAMGRAGVNLLGTRGHPPHTLAVLQD